MKHRTRTKALSWLLSLALVLGLTPGLSLTALAATANVSYLYYANEADAIASVTTSDSQTCTAVESGTTTWSDGWYAVNADVTVSDRIEVSGMVNLILCDGATLTASKGIHVTGDNSLTIYGQTGGTGALSATGIDHAAGIGGNISEPVGTVVIHGGRVTAYGKGKSEKIDEYYFGGGAGIGGGSGSIASEGNRIVSEAGRIEINGGTVNATGYQGSAGIGGGYIGHSCEIVINGGDVTSTGAASDSGGGSSGIGTGVHGGKGPIIINGGTIHSTGRGSSSSAIGSGSPLRGHSGDYYTLENAVTTIVINGGYVDATNNYGVGIGGTNCDLTINGGTIRAVGDGSRGSAVGFKYMVTDYGTGLGGGYSNGSSKVTLNWTSLSDSIYVSSVWAKTINITSDKNFADSEDPYVPLTASQISALTGKTIVPLKSTTYREGQWNETSGTTNYTNQTFLCDDQHDFTYIDANVTAWTDAGNDGLYVTSGDVKVTAPISVTGDVKLVLTDGFYLERSEWDPCAGGKQPDHLS